MYMLYSYTWDLYGFPSCLSDSPFPVTACGSAATSSTKEQGLKRSVKGFKKCSLAWYLVRARWQNDAK